MMTREEMERQANAIARKAWIRFQTLFPTCGDCPVVVMNGRLRTTAGRAWLDFGKVDLSVKLYAAFTAEMNWDTIPHELAHHVAYRVFGDKGHGKHWKHVMIRYGLEPRIYHSMEIK